MISKFCFSLGFAVLFQACCLFSTTTTQKAMVNWQTNYETAVNQSKATSKPLLMFFTGSDWCSWCHKLEDEALNTQEFVDTAGDRFIFLKVDSPLYSPQDPQEKAQNKQLQQRYEVRSFPLIIIVDPAHNQQIGTTGYRPGGGKAFADTVNKMVSDFSAYRQKMGVLDTETFSGTVLKELFAKSKELDLENDSIRIIKAGMDSNESLFFYLERYRLFADEGMIHTREAKALRQQLFAADPKNVNQTYYHLAVIDFEANCCLEEKEELTAEQMVAPLVSYITKFAGKDKDNIWRLEMIVSQVYLDKNDMNNALTHAQASYENAPPNAKIEIAKTVNSLQSQLQVRSPLAKKIISARK